MSSFMITDEVTLLSIQMNNRNVYFCAISEESHTKLYKTKYLALSKVLK